MFSGLGPQNKQSIDKKISAYRESELPFKNVTKIDENISHKGLAVVNKKVTGTEKSLVDKILKE